MKLNQERVVASIVTSWQFAVVSIVILALTFSVFEPTISRAAASATDTFVVRQQITDEISFLVTASDVNMVGSIQGVTGGHATGSTYAVVRSNSNSGYTLDIAFSSNPAMLGTSTLSTAILNFATSGTQMQPSYAFTASTAAQFGYTVSASTSSDLDPSFLNDTTICNSGSTYTANTCWMTPSTTAYRIVNRTTAAPSGATTTITFRVTVPQNPSPSVEEDYYVATATLTATNQ
jgi:hypothetical protein